MLAASRSKLVEEAAGENEINMGTGEEISAEGREREIQQGLFFHSVSLRPAQHLLLPFLLLLLLYK